MTELNRLAHAIPGVVILAVISCGGQNGRHEQSETGRDKTVQTTDGQPVIFFDTTVHDFGTIIEGEKVVCYFDYWNRGGEDLLISNVEATCGCTIPDWSREPLLPGEKEELKIIFDTSGRSGTQIKVVNVMSNASTPQVRLTLRAIVNNSV